MTKKEAKAILKFQEKTNKTLDMLESQLEDGAEKDHAMAYWIAHIRAAANGQGYGSAPIEAAERMLESSTV